MSKELLTMLIAASPLSELRGAIPAAVLGWGMPAWKAFLLSVIGNALPIIPLLAFWRWLVERLMHRFYTLNRFFTWLFERVRVQHSEKFLVWEELALLIFVAIPLPLTGVWSATVAAFVFKIPFWQSVLMIFGGVLIAGLIVLLLTTGLTVF